MSKKKGKKSYSGYQRKTFTQTEVKAGPAETYAYLVDLLGETAAENDVALDAVWTTTHEKYTCMFKAWNTDHRPFWLDQVAGNLGVQLWNAVLHKHSPDRKAENKADVVFQQYMKKIK